MIALIWCLSLFIMFPVALTARLQKLQIQVTKCTENWGDKVVLYRIYNFLLLFLLLVGPLIIMIVGYTSIAFRLYVRGRDQGKKSNSEARNKIHLQIYSTDFENHSLKSNTCRPKCIKVVVQSMLDILDYIIKNLLLYSKSRFSVIECTIHLQEDTRSYNSFA